MGWTAIYLYKKFKQSTGLPFSAPFKQREIRERCRGKNEGVFLSFWVEDGDRLLEGLGCSGQFIFPRM